MNPFRIERYYAKYEFAVEHMLSSSDSESHSIRDVLALEEGSSEQLLDLRLGYTESAGDPRLREAIASTYENVEPDDIVVHSGAEEAIFTFMSAALEAGDHVVAHSPAYQSLHEIARSIGCEVSEWTAHHKDGWRLDLDRLRALIRPDTKVIVVNTPHNPTGWLMSRADYEALGSLAASRGIVLFADEVYRELEHDPAARLPAACDGGPHAVSLGVMSKSYGLPGLRIGWLVIRDQALRKRVVEMKDYTTICSSGPSEFIATVALKHRETILGRNREIALSNLALLEQFFDERRELLEWVKPDAGAICFPRLRSGEEADELCHRAAQEAGVLLLPGSTYGDAWSAHIRMGFGRKAFPGALGRFVEFLDRD